MSVILLVQVLEAILKILIFRTFPSILDPEGYNIQEIGFAKALVRAGVTCDVILYNGSNGNQTKEIDVFDNGINVGTVKVFMRKGVGILKNGFFAGIKAIAKDYDLIQVHEYDQISSWLYYVWFNKPVVIYHGPYYDAFNKGYNLKCKIFDNTFLKLRSGKRTLCFTKSKAATSFLLDKGFEKSIPIGVGLDIDNFNAVESVHLPEEIEKASSGKWNALYVGKIEPRRNSLMLLDVINEVAKREENIHFTIIGSGESEYLNAWLEKARPLIDSGVLTYVEKLTQPQLRSLYEKMQVMVFPSNYEIFGMVLLEAMYFNLPIISSDNGGSDTLITDGVDGIIVDGFEVNSWANAIIDLYTDKSKYDGLVKALKEKDRSVYTWDGIAKKYLQAIKENLDI